MKGASPTISVDIHVCGLDRTWSDTTSVIWMVCMFVCALSCLLIWYNFIFHGLLRNMILSSYVPWLAFEYAFILYSMASLWIWYLKVHDLLMNMVSSYIPWLAYEYAFILYSITCLWICYHCIVRDLLMNIISSYIPWLTYEYDIIPAQNHQFIYPFMLF